MRAALCAGRPAISNGPASHHTAVYLALQATDRSVLGFFAFGCDQDCLNEQVATTVVQAARIIALTAQLDQLRQHHERVIGLIGHELRQPLSALTAAIEVVRRSLAVPRPRSFEIAHRQVLRLVSLVDSLLDLSRVLAGKLGIIREPADMRTILLFAIESVKTDLEAHRQTLHLDIPDRPVWCTGDASRLQQVFVNLLSNAQRYTQDGSEITVTLQDGDELRVSVNDNGPGIEPDAREHIFRPFMQKADTGQGLGLGLSISRHLVHLHDGTLTVHTGDGGVGSRFVVTMPCVHVKREQAASVRPGTLRE
jgi:signal transduction histidine kinase